MISTLPLFSSWFLSCEVLSSDSGLAKLTGGLDVGEGVTCVPILETKADAFCTPGILIVNGRCILSPLVPLVVTVVDGSLAGLSRAP